MRTIKTKVYKFNELSEQAKNKAIEQWRKNSYDQDDLMNMLIEEIEEDLKEDGIINPKVLYSGFGSQGDGACFTCDYTDAGKFLKDEKYKGISFKITHNGRYYFAKSTNVEVSDEDISHEMFNEVEKKIEDERELLGNDIYERLETYYMYLLSDEQIIDNIEANEYEFTEDGKMI